MRSPDPIHLRKSFLLSSCEPKTQQILWSIHIVSYKKTNVTLREARNLGFKDTMPLNIIFFMSCGHGIWNTKWNLNWASKS